MTDVRITLLSKAFDLVNDVQANIEDVSDNVVKYSAVALGALDAVKEAVVDAMEQLVDAQADPDAKPAGKPTDPRLDVDPDAGSEQTELTREEKIETIRNLIVQKGGDLGGWADPKTVAQLSDAGVDFVYALVVESRRHQK